MEAKKKLGLQNCDPSEQPTNQGGERITLFALDDEVKKAYIEIRRLLHEALIIEVIIDCNPDPRQRMNKNLADGGKKLLKQAKDIIKSLCEKMEHYEFESNNEVDSQNVNPTDNINENEHNHGRNEDIIPTELRSFGAAD